MPRCLQGVPPATFVCLQQTWNKLFIGTATLLTKLWALQAELIAEVKSTLAAQYAQTPGEEVYHWHAHLITMLQHMALSTSVSSLVAAESSLVLQAEHHC